MANSQHAYFLKTSADYRSNYVAEVIIRMAQLVEVLALRNGLQFDRDTGEIIGLTDEERAQLMEPVVDRNDVKEARPLHRTILTEVSGVDIYAATPDPSVSFGSEAVGDSPVQSGFLIDYHSQESEESEGSEDSGASEEKKSKKERLQDEAESLGLDSAGTVAELQERIAEHKASLGEDSESKE
jgi:hypothetical protein